MIEKSDIIKQIYGWNKRFPVDCWWRDKHNIAFNSEQHREASFTDQMFEYFEFMLANKKEEEEPKYNKQGRFLQVDKKSIDDWFDSDEF